MLMRDVRLRAFHAVATHRSFTRAAVHLHSSQQAISLHVQRLEADIGARLFVRGQKQADLTEEGHLLFTYAQQIVALYSQAENALAEHTGRGRALRVAITNSLTNLDFATAIDRFRKAYPGMEVEIEVGHTAYCLDRLSDDSTDLAIISEGVGGSQMEYLPFLSDEIVLITSPTGIFSDRMSITPRELHGVPFIARTNGSGTRAILEARLRNADYELDQLKIAMTLGSADAVKRSVIAGLGLGAVSRLAVKAELQSGSLKALRLEGMDLSRKFISVRRQGSGRRQIIRGFLTMMEMEAGPQNATEKWATLEVDR